MEMENIEQAIGSASSRLRWNAGSISGLAFSRAREAGPWFNIKMPSYQYRKSHCGDKTVVRPSYLHNMISNTGKNSLYWIGAQCPMKSPAKTEKTKKGKKPEKMMKTQKTKTNIRVATWNLGTQNDREAEVVETLSRWLVDICGVQEDGFKDAQVRTLTGKDCKFKFFCARDGIVLAENWADKFYLLKYSASLTGSFFSN